MGRGNRNCLPSETPIASFGSAFIGWSLEHAGSDDAAVDTTSDQHRLTSPDIILQSLHHRVSRCILLDMQLHAFRSYRLQTIALWCKIIFHNT